MNTPFKKRANPLAQQIKPVEQTVQQEVPVQPQPIQVEIPQQQIVSQQPQSKPIQQVYYQAPQQRVIRENSREKYTATMKKELRKRIKIAAATKGIQFSQYIEEAVMDKLRKEGF